MYAIFGDLHGDVEALEKFLSFLGRDIPYIFFTGDFFGLLPSQECEDILAERERQYSVMDDLLEEYKGKLLAVPGNYDYPFEDYFQQFDLHHKTTYVGGKKIYGHGGSHHAPSLNQFNWKDFCYQNPEREFELLCEVNADVILSHSPVRKYVGYCLLQDPRKTDIIYLGGHTHVYQYYRVSCDEKGVYIVRPGALGKTVDNEMNQLLPQTFMIIDTSDMEKASLYTLEGASFTEEEVTVKNKTLREYNNSEKMWGT